MSAVKENLVYVFIYIARCCD